MKAGVIEIKNAQPLGLATAVIKPLKDELKEQQTVSIEDLYSFYKTL